MHTKVVIIICILVITVLFGIVRAADPTTAELTYNSVTNSFIFNVTPDAAGDVSMYYSDDEGNIDAMFGEEGESLAAETCSTGTCLPDNVEYGVAKLYVEEEQWLYIVKFKIVGGFTILDEDVYPDVKPEDVKADDYIGEPPANVLLQLANSERDWLEEPSQIIFSPTPTLSITPVPTVLEDAMSSFSILAASTSATITLTPSPTPSDPQIPGTCSNGEGWVNAYIPAGTTQGTQQDGMPVPAYRTSPTYGFNAPDALFYAMGIGGVVTYKFPGQITDLHDADGETDFSIYETTFGRSTYPEEKATVQVSQNGTTWFTLSQIARGRASVTGVSSLDFHETGLSWIQYVKLTDISIYPLGILDADGFDVNAIGGRDQSCAPTPTPTKTPTLTPTKTPTITLTPSPTPSDPITPPICTEGQGFLSEYIAGTQGTQQDGLPVPPYRTSPTYAFGSPDAVYYSLGLGGTATYKFAGLIQNVAGADLSIYEETLGRMTYPIERAQLRVSEDGITWFTLSTLATGRFNILGVSTIDFNETGLSQIQYIRFNDVTVPPVGIPEADGFDINSVVATSQTCPEAESGLLSIRKFNTAGIQSPGGEVTYFMEVEALENPVDNVEVLDLPPEGFKYIGGSWTAKSDDTTRGSSGDLKTGGITTEPTYASPGTWKLGNMSPGEKVILSYKVKISDSIDGGVYGDLAWSQGESGAVLGVGTSSSYVNNEFVGSEVVVAKNTQTTASINVQREEKREQSTAGNVLGASTKLPATGASELWLLVAGLLAVLGVTSIYAGYRLAFVRKVNKGRIINVNKIHIFLLAVVLGLSVQSVDAAAITTIRIAIPQDKINTNNFRIGFVTMDSDSRALAVQCWKKGPADPGFIPFGPVINVKAGGNSGFCNVDSSVVGQSGANYQFMASAKAAASPEVFSQTVGTSFSNQAPGTPINYNKEQAGCTYRIRFRTASDGGKTKKVEIYRSENTSFTADNGTKVGEVLAGSNQSKLFENTPDCGKKFYYVIRAFDDFGNGSGLTGDSEVTVTTVTTNTNTSTTASTGTGGSQTGGALLAQGAGNVAAPGAETEDDVQGEATAEAVQEEPVEDVLGENEKSEEMEQKEAQQTMNIIIGVIIAVILGNLAYVFAKKRARK